MQCLLKFLPASFPRGQRTADISPLQSAQKGLTFRGKGLGSQKESSPKSSFFPAAPSSLSLLVFNGVDQVRCNTEKFFSPTFRFLGHNLDSFPLLTLPACFQLMIILNSPASHFLYSSL